MKNIFFKKERKEIKNNKKKQTGFMMANINYPFFPESRISTEL